MRSVTCYFTPGSPKGRKCATALAEGARACGIEGALAEGGPLRPGPAAFYGVKAPLLPLFDRVKAEGRDWFYMDNGYFGRNRFFRVTRNALQFLPAADAPFVPGRFEMFGIPIAPWRKPAAGRHILLCLQSEWHMNLTAGLSQRAWRDATVAEIRRHSDRRIRIRLKADFRPLAQDLRGAWALVTWSSNAAVEAVLAGVPAFVLGPCAALPMGGADLARLEDPPMPEGRARWARVLASNQWKRHEIAEGKAWRWLQKVEGGLHG